MGYRIAISKSPFQVRGLNFIGLPSISQRIELLSMYSKIYLILYFLLKQGYFLQTASFCPLWIMFPFSYHLLFLPLTKLTLIILMIFLACLFVLVVGCIWQVKCITFILHSLLKYRYKFQCFCVTVSNSERFFCQRVHLLEIQNR